MENVVVVRKNTLELLLIYKYSLQNGKFQRRHVADCMEMPPYIAKRRWYGELKRTRKYGVSHDWKTLLNHLVVSSTRDTAPALIHAIDLLMDWMRTNSLKNDDIIQILTKQSQIQPHLKNEQNVMDAKPNSNNTASTTEPFMDDFDMQYVIELYE